MFLVWLISWITTGLTSLAEIHQILLGPVSITTEAVPTPTVSSSLLTARKQVEEAYTVFQEQRLQKGERFHDTIKNLKLKTFSDMKKKTANGPTKEIALKADLRLFGTWFSLPKAGTLEMRDVLYHPLAHYHGH